MSRFLLSIEEEEFRDNVADMIACSTDENLLRTPSWNATPACSETLKRFNEPLQRFRIYPLSYEALHRFIEALSNLTCPLPVIHSYTSKLQTFFLGRRPGLIYSILWKNI